MALRKLHEMVEQYDTPYVVSATPTSHLGWRGPRELGALGAVCGFDPSWTRHGLGEWGRIVERNRERFDPTFVEPGVRRGQYDGSRGDR
jgi:ribonuclease P/MRP protein subunit RPP1